MIEHIKHEISSLDKIELSNNSMWLADKASVPAGGPFIVLPLVHETAVPAGELFVLYSTSQLAFRCRFGHSYCPSVKQLTLQIEMDNVHFAFVFRSMRQTYQPSPFA